MRSAIVHYWLVAMRGGERVVEELCRLLPDAALYAHVANPGALTPLLRERLTGTTWINRLPRAARLYQSYLPFMPLALESLDLSWADLVVSSESGPAKGVVLPASTAHLCYCHTPMRYIWSMYHDYRRSAGPIKRALIPPIAHYLRMWDRAAADRVDVFAANSQTVAKRIWKYYRREALVIHPPVAVERFSPASEGPDEYYLCAGQLTGYKRTDLAVAACERLGRPLVVAGTGPDEKRLRAMAGKHTRFIGRVSDDELARLYARCRALLFPGEEDFGIVPVEAMASGRPVIAYGLGGATETIVPDATGMLFTDQTTEGLARAIQRFEEGETAFDQQAIVAHAQQFATSRFRREFRDAVREELGLRLPDATG